MQRHCRIVPLALCLLLTLCAVPVARAAEPEGQTVRVGWYESPFNLTDNFGRRSGYAYEYQQMIAAYTGWTYEYVEGSWPELYQMLLDGEIDLMSDVSYTEERAEQMLFCMQPMGTEDYYISVSVHGGNGISIEDTATLNDKTIGVSRDSVQEGQLNAWIAANGVQAQVVELMTGESENIAMLDTGDLDAYVSVDSYGSVHNLFPLWKIGSSEYYFALSKQRPDLLSGLNSAMSRIMDGNRYYNQKLQEKYLDALLDSGYLSQNELNWLDGHETIRVGYEEHFLPFCDTDEGELTGGLRDFLDFASTSMRNGTFHFEPVAYPTILDALRGMKNGEVECIFPVNMAVCDGEEYGVLLTDTVMQTEMYVSVRAADLRDFSLGSRITAAISEGDANYETFLMDNFPDWNFVTFENKEACCKAVADGEADCVFTCNYRLNLNEDLFRKYNLSTISTGRTMRFSFAVNREDDYLHGMLNKINSFQQNAVMDAALASYSYVERQVTVMEFLRSYMIPVLVTLESILLVILILLIRSRRAEKRAKDALRALQESLGREEIQRRELNVTKHKAYTDPLTGVKSKQAYLEAVNNLHNRMTAEEQLDFAVVVFDVNDLKRVNDEQGHEAGDRHIRAASSLICETFKHSPIFRIGGDEFASILERKDYFTRDTLMKAFNTMIEENLREGRVVVSAGMAVYNPAEDEDYKTVFQRADEAMYERKRFLKGGRDVR